MMRRLILQEEEIYTARQTQGGATVKWHAFVIQIRKEVCARLVNKRFCFQGHLVMPGRSATRTRGTSLQQREQYSNKT